MLLFSFQETLQQNINSLRKENDGQNLEIEELKWQSNEKDSVIKVCFGFSVIRFVTVVQVYAQRFWKKTLRSVETAMNLQAFDRPC